AGSEHATAGTGARAIQYFLFALPRPQRRRTRCCRPARHAAAAQFSRRRITDRGRSAPLRRHLGRLRRHVWLWRPRASARPLGDRCLYPSAAAQPARRTCRPAGRSASPPARGDVSMSPRALIMASAAGFAGCAIGLYFEPKTILASYLVAWTAVSAVPIGAIAVLATTYLVRGGWTQDLNRSLSAA